MSRQAAIVSGVAGRYATALFELAYEAKALDDVAGELSELDRLITENEDLAAMIRNPLLERREQSAVMEAIADKADFSGLVANFLAIVSRNRRLAALPEMIGGFHRLVAEHRGQVTAQVLSAMPLSDDQRQTLSQRISKVYGQDVTIETEVDESLLAGLRVRVGSRLIDNSLKTKIEQLQLAMKEGV